MSTQDSPDIEVNGRGLHVTAIHAVLNMSEGDVLLTPFADPEHRRLIKPGLFTYPRGTTVPIKWEHDRNSLIELGGHGYMWQPGGHAEVYFKRDAMPTSANDGRVMWTRHHGHAGEQYLVLGVYPDRVEVVKSYTTLEFLWKELSGAVLETLGVLRPEHYDAIAAQPHAALRFADAIKTHAEHIQGVGREVFDALSSASPDKWEQALAGLSESEKSQLATAAPSSDDGLRLAQKILNGLSVGIGALTAGIAAVILSIGIVLAAFAVVTWPAILTLAGILGAVLLLTGAIVAFLQLAAYIVGLFISDSDSDSAVPEAVAALLAS